MKRAGFAAAQITATLYKDPSCPCCDADADYLRANGFNVTVVEQPNMAPIKQKYGGHRQVRRRGARSRRPHQRLLAEKPDIKCLSLPGMPQGSPGMSGTKQAPFEVLAIPNGDGPAPVYASE